MALQKDRSRINVKGGGDLRIRELKPTPTSTFSKIGHIKGTDFIDEHTMVESIDDSGNYIDTNSGARKAMIKSVLMQSSLEEINLMRNAVGKYYEVYYRCVLANGSIQELSIAVAKIKPGAVLAMKSATERDIELEIYCLAPNADLVRAPVAYNVTENEPYVLIENTAGNDKGEPTDAASAVAVLI